MRARKQALPPIQEAMEVSSPLTVHSLVERAANGDAESFRELFERYADRVYRYSHTRLRRPEDAQDATQDVFLAVWRGLSSFRYVHEGSFAGWVFAIARNIVAEHQRRSLRRPGVPMEGAMADPVEFEGRLVDARLVGDELDRLPETQREVLILRFVVGLRAREAGIALGKSEAAVMALQMRGLEQLRRRIGPER
jgi:RNA polymerase sigma-70 factor (ECF subfamily)